MKNVNIFLCLLMNLDAFAFNTNSYNKNYDPKRDPFYDFELAPQDAVAQNKQILIVLGGDWCSWCFRLGSFIKNNDKIKSSSVDLLEITFRRINKIL